MSTLSRCFVTAVALALLAGLAARAADRDDLDKVRDRMKVEAERLEKEFTDERVAAYKLVRSDSPRLLESTEKLQTLLAMIRNDTSLNAGRRELLIVTLKADLDRVKQIAGERRRFSVRRDEVLINRAVAAETRRADDGRRAEPVRRVSDDARSLIESRGRSVVDARVDRNRAGDRYNKLMRSVDESALPEPGNIRYPRDWAERMRKRSAGATLTAKEKAIMKALGTSISVDFEKNTFEDVIDYLKKATGIEILVDRRALEEVSVKYDSPISLRLKASTRTILKRILGDLNLTYIIKDEAIQITSRERANQMTTVRTYYIGDLAMVADVRIPLALSQLMMLESVNRIITMITQNVDAQTWRVNNPDAAGTIAFDPITMTLVVKQTAEVHFMLGGYK